MKITEVALNYRSPFCSSIITIPVANTRLHTNPSDSLFMAILSGFFQTMRQRCNRTRIETSETSEFWVNKKEGILEETIFWGGGQKCSASNTDLAGGKYTLEKGEDRHERGNGTGQFHLRIQTDFRTPPSAASAQPSCHWQGPPSLPKSLNLNLTRTRLGGRADTHSPKVWGTQEQGSKISNFHIKKSNGGIHKGWSRQP